MSADRHTISFADRLFRGEAKHPSYEGGKRGLLIPPTYVENMGAIAAADPDGLGVFATTATGTLTLTGALVSSSVGTFDVPRVPVVACTGDISSFTFTFTGTDRYGQALVQEIIGPTGGAGGSRSGLQAMKTVTAVTVTGAPTTTGSVGTGDTFDFPFRIPDKGAVISVSADGVPETTLTLAAGLATSSTPGATTADVRGTWTPNTSPNGTIAWTVAMLYDPTDSTLAFGLAPYSG